MPVAVASDRRFRRAKVKPARRRRSWIVRAGAVLRSILAAACFVVGAYLVGDHAVHAGVLRVDHIAVHGNVHLSTGEVLALLDGVRGQHVLRVDLERWRQRLLGSPWVESAALRRVLPSTIEVFIRERQPVAIGRLHDELYLVDAGGRIIDEYGPNYLQFDLPIVDGLASDEPGEPLVDDGRAALAGEAIAALRRNEHLYKRVSQIVMTGERDAAVLLEDDRTLVHLGDEQFLERLQAYVDIAPALRSQVEGIDSVDLRFDGRAYVRPQKAARRTAR
jgi:cell division septal protein FtsQ